MFPGHLVFKEFVVFLVAIKFDQMLILLDFKLLCFAFFFTSSVSKLLLIHVLCGF